MCSRCALWKRTKDDGSIDCRQTEGFSYPTKM
nr:MAG TPA: hypothetical protein [Caudoviricetes sp.]